MRKLDEPTRLLHEAIEHNDSAGVSNAIDQGADLHALREDGWHLLACVDYAVVLKMLLKAGADPNTSSEHSPPLYWAAASNNLQITQILVDAGATVEAELPLSEEGETSLHVAAEQGSLAMVELLLAAGGKATLNTFDYIDRTPLICAVDSNNTEIVRVLIDAGSNVNMVATENRISDPAIKHAVREACIEIIQLLVEAGADPRITGWMQCTAFDELEHRTVGDSGRVRQLLEDAIRKPRMRG